MAYVVIYLYVGWCQDGALYPINMIPFFIHQSTYKRHRLVDKGTEMLMNGTSSGTYTDELRDYTNGIGNGRISMPTN